MSEHLGRVGGHIRNGGYLVLNCGVIRLLMVRMCLIILREWVATFRVEVTIRGLELGLSFGGSRF